MKYKLLPLVLFFLMSFTTNKNTSVDPKLSTTTTVTFETKVASIYNTLKANHLALPQLPCFSQALKGFYQLKEHHLVQKDLLTLIDFSLSSNTKRLWIIDLATNTVLLNTFVAHGRTTGEEFAKTFSNDASSFKSSLGFYVTGEIYQGKHGMSLKLDGLEKGVNDKARERGIVMHAADYVSTTFIQNNKRLGRSQGCPAIPAELTSEIIQTIKNKSCLFIYHPSRKTEEKSALFS